MLKGVGQLKHRFAGERAQHGNQIDGFSSDAALPAMYQQGLELDQGLTNYSPKAQSGPLPVFAQLVNLRNGFCVFKLLKKK